MLLEAIATGKADAGVGMALRWLKALEQGFAVKPVLLGPVTYLWLGKVKGAQFDRLSLLPSLSEAYKNVLEKLAQRGIEWIQIDEPALVLDLPPEWQDAYRTAYDALQGHAKLLLTTYFDGVSHHLPLIRELPVQGLHVDFVAGGDDIQAIHDALPADWLLSAGLINGRNV